jgi:predicted nuclease with RNAse H fold
MTVGVDLAAEPKKTAIAVIDWAGSTATVRHLQLGVTDPEIVALSAGAEMVGIDCPFGWPVEFVEFVSAHSRGEVAPRQLFGSDWRRRLAYRDTDRFVREQVGRWPLSVSTDRLGLTAMHCAELLDAFEREDRTPMDRSGDGRYVEVYPAAALRVWSIPVDGYKTDPAARAVATIRLRAAVPWLELRPTHIQAMSSSDDAFDAVVAALISRAHAQGATHPIPDHSHERATTEGWMALPTAPIGELVRD